MIVLVREIEGGTYRVRPGDTLNLSISGLNREKIIISEKITKPRLINYIAAFCSAQEDGKCIGFNMCGFFGNNNCLPREIKEAVRFRDLTAEQRKNFTETCEIVLDKENI